MLHSGALIEIAEKIWKSESTTFGPALVISGGIHGNERTGVEVVLRIKHALENGILSHTSGALFLLLGNLKAIEQNERWSDSAIDLNRCFGALPERMRGSFEAQRAETIKKALAIQDRQPNSVIGIDIHATNKPSKPFLVLQPRPSSLLIELFSHITQAHALLYDPDWIFTGVPATFDDYFNAHNQAGFCYETGCADDLSRVDEVFNEIVSLAHTRGILKWNGEMTASQTKGTNSLPVFALRHAIILSGQGFFYAPAMGSATFQEFSSGDLLGYHGSAPLTADFDGVFIFPKLHKHWKLGEAVGFLAEKTLY